MAGDRRRVDPQRVARGLRQGAELVERVGQGDVAGAVEEVLDNAHIGERLEGAARTATRESLSREAVHTTATPALQDRPRTPEVRTVVPAVPSKAIDPAAILRDGYTCPTPWSGELADVVVICCSSEKYELQNQELVRALGYRMPHFIQVPGGPAVLYGLAAVSGFLTKAMGIFVDKAVDLLDISEVICIAHEDCGAYKPGRISVIGELTRRLSNKGMKDAQIEHLRKAARDLQGRLGHGVEVRAFYGHIAESGQQKQIRFEPIGL